jgi:hypothetical protein
MPIRFRCQYCNKLLGIARRKAGTETTCPQCGSAIIVPQADSPGELRLDLDEIDALLKPSTPPPAPATTEPEPAAVEPERFPEDERPLFEREIDAVLGVTNDAERPLAAKPKPPPTSGADALSLDEPSRGIVLSSQRATAIIVAAVVLLILAFAAGYLIASSK